MESEKKSKRVMYTGIILHVLGKLSFVLGSYCMHFFLGRYLSEEQYGVFGVIITIINFEYIFFTDGVRQGMSKCISEGKYREKELLKTGLYFQLALIGIFFMGTFAGAPVIAYILKDARLIPYIRGIAVLLPVTGIYSLSLGILNGHKNFSAEAGVSMIYPILKLSVIPAVLFLFSDAIFGTEGGFLFAGGICMVLALIFVYRLRSQFSAEGEVIGWWEYGKTTMNYLLLFCVSTVMMNLDSLILKRVSGSDEIVGYYTGVATFAKIPYFLLTAFYTVALPIVTRHYAAGETREAGKEIASLMTLIVSFLLPVVTVISAASGHILGLFYKPTYRAGENSLSLLVFAIAFLGMTLVFTMILSAADRKKQIAWISVCMLFAQIILCPILSTAYSLTGTAAATLITAGCGMLVSGFLVIRIFGRFWEKKHSLILLLNLGVFAFIFSLFKKVQISSFLLLVVYCGISYAIPAGIAAAKMAFDKYKC